MKVLLLQTRRQAGLGLNGFIVIEPLGLEVVAASLKGHHVRILDLFDDRELLREVEDFKPQAVGIGCSFTTDVQRAIALAGMVKSVNREVFIFVGGHHPSRMPEDFRYPLVDAVVIGDGEATAPHLIDALEGGSELFGIAGLAVNTPDGQVRNPERPLTLDMKRLEIPDRDLTNRYRKRYYLGMRHPVITMETSRGCPYRCNFCSVWKFHHGKVRFQAPERVIKEIKTLPRGDVLFTDDNFLADAHRAYRIAEMIERQGLRRRYIFQARSDSVVRHPEVIRKWASAGLSAVFIGFEKIEDAGLSSLNKHNSSKNNEEALKLLRSLKISVYASFIIDPTFTHPDFEKVSRYVKRLKIQDPYFSVLTPLPGTELYEQTKRQITTKAYELYDLLHAVLPTQLPLKQFYKEFADLYRKAYLADRGTWKLAASLAARFFSREIPISQVKRLRKNFRLLVDADVYLSNICSAGCMVGASDGVQES